MWILGILAKLGTFVRPAILFQKTPIAEHTQLQTALSVPHFLIAVVVEAFLYAAHSRMGHEPP